MENIKPLNVVHVLYQSIPNISGSSTRSYDIVSSQIKIGLKPTILTSPFQQGKNVMYGYEIIEGVNYYRTYNNNKNQEVSETGNKFIKRIFKLFSVFGFYSKIKKVALENKADIIHSHAMFFCGIPSFFVARKLNIPHVYEVRSLWEERKKDANSKSLFVKLEYKVLRFLETYTMKKSNHVIAINENLRLDIIKRGINPKKISVIPNAVNIDFIESQKTKKNDKSINDSSFVIGYIGSISPIEGLDNLVKVVKRLNAKNNDIKLFIYGSGKEDEITKLRGVISEDNNIQLKGSIVRADIYKAYNEVSIIVNPRVKSKLTDSVTPLKPLEAMGFEKIVIASDVGGMKELIENNKTGFLYPSEDIQALEDVIEKVHKLKENDLLEIKSNALKYVREHRSWDANAKLYYSIYRKLIGR
jgi:glycogen(starch) synthase